MPSSRRFVGVFAGIAALLAGIAGPSAAAEHGGGFGRATLTQWAMLPAQTWVTASEPSGSQLGAGPVNGIPLPFADQPVQGFSGVVNNHDGTFEVLSDNGYGAKSNSADFALRINRIAPDFRAGRIDVVGGINLTDPHAHVPFPLTRPDRVLTGADLDPESFLRATDGTYWIGDEFGPYLLHVDRGGRLLSAPIPVDGVCAPENPCGGNPPNLPGSRGFEGMGLSPDKRTAYPLLEGTVAGDSPGDLRLYQFDLRSAAFTGKRWTYRLDAPAHAIGDVAVVDANRFLVIERDNEQGDAALVKKVYLADRRDRNHDGVMDKTLVADLLDIANPKGVGGFGPTFRFPFVTIEDVVILGDRTLGILNDNNFPFSTGRAPNQPDNNEFITIRLGARLHVDPRVLR